jgi:hypothetical protein
MCLQCIVPIAMLWCIKLCALNNNSRGKLTEEPKSREIKQQTRCVTLSVCQSRNIRGIIAVPFKTRRESPCSQISNQDRHSTETLSRAGFREECI